MEVVKIENVTRTYKVGKIETQALRGVNLSIKNGEFTALIGPSGSGKTTLLQMIGCLDQPTSGQVFINDKNVTKLNRNQRADMRRGTIGFVFQFFALIPTLTAYENIEMPLLLNGHSANGDDRNTCPAAGIGNLSRIYSNAFSKRKTITGIGTKFCTKYRAN